MTCFRSIAPPIQLLLEQHFILLLLNLCIRMNNFCLISQVCYSWICYFWLFCFDYSGCSAALV